MKSEDKLKLQLLLIDLEKEDIDYLLKLKATTGTESCTSTSSKLAISYFLQKQYEERVELTSRLIKSLRLNY